MLRLLEGKANVFQYDGAPPHIHNEVTNILVQAVAQPVVRPKGVQSLASAISTSDPLQLVLWGFVSDDVYVSPILVGPNILKDRRRRTTSESANHSAIRAAQSWIWSDMCRETNVTRTELAQAKKKNCDLSSTIIYI
jgi:hypothetical protein